MVTTGNTCTRVARSCILMVILCLAGCVAGSCKTYGHSCWGAHGKRSGSSNGPYLILAKTTTNDDDRSVVSLSKNRWILSRLIDGSSNPSRRRFEWSDMAKMKGFLPRHWQHEETTTNIVSNDLRNQNNEDNDDKNSREDPIENSEILLIPEENYSIDNVEPQKLSLFRILKKTAENFN